MKGKDFTPLIMWFFLASGIVVLAFIRPGRMIGIWDGCRVNFDTVFVASYILWMLIELRISIKDVDTKGKKTSSSAICLGYGTGQALTFLTALWFQPVWQAPNSAHFLGLTLFLFGVCYRLWAVHTLGQFYSHKVQTVGEHIIVASGPYRFTRHPAYAGMIVANTGICFYFFNWVTVFAFALMLIPAVLLRIMAEERMLYEIEEYPAFAAKRKRLCPRVW
jgi:protein-S-isoprenylcysteine O-methyltransferase Ste14